jgi:hypothetical protein
MVQPTSYLFFVSMCFVVGYFVRKEFFLLVSPLAVAVVVIFVAIGVKKLLYWLKLKVSCL